MLSCLFKKIYKVVSSVSEISDSVRGGERGGVEKIPDIRFLAEGDGAVISS